MPWPAQENLETSSHFCPIWEFFVIFLLNSDSYSVEKQFKKSSEYKEET